jgi:acyl-CoA synthetase (AMP-forming)/AMP-acid ligase II
VPAGDDPPDPDRLVALVRSRLSANSVPKTVTTIHDVPVNAAGKPDKGALLNRTGTAPHG